METSNVNMSIEQLLERILEQDIALQKAQIGSVVLQDKLESCRYDAKSSLLRVLGYVDARSREALTGKKVEMSELEKIIVIGIVSLKRERDSAERMRKDFERSLNELTDKYIEMINEGALK